MVEWFKGLNEDQKVKVAQHLFENALTSEWVDIRDEESAKWLAEESGESVESYLAPYFSTCGDSLLSD